MEHNFSVGDHVIFNPKSGDYNWLKGHCGTIVGFFEYNVKKVAKVEWEEKIFIISESLYTGHSCDGLSKLGYGWNALLEDLELFIPEDDCSLEMQGKEFESLI